MTGLGASGVEIMLVVLEEKRAKMVTPSHPMIPLFRVLSNAGLPCDSGKFKEDFDFILDSVSQDTWLVALLELLVKASSLELSPNVTHLSDFQVARGALGISM